ncbi:MAG: phage shock protein PspA [Maricaulaceae bacterium]|jgi:phage shock protein A
MGVFSRMSDIINSNINAMLEKAEDPEKIARLIIQEMEETLVEVRTAAARSIADKKSLTRKVQGYRDLVAEWDGKAELAIEKGREDLARGALAEKHKNAKKVEVIEKELGIIDEAIGKANSDMTKLQAKLDEAKAKHKALALRRKTAEGQIRMRTHIADTKIDDALLRYEVVERKVDELEAQAESFDLGRKGSLSGEIEALEVEEEIEEELAQLKRRMRGGGSSSGRSSSSSSRSTPPSEEFDAD